MMIYEKVCQDMKGYMGEVGLTSTSGMTKYENISLAPWCPSQKMLFQIKYVGALVILVRGCQAKVHLPNYFMKIQIILIDVIAICHWHQYAYCCHKDRHRHGTKTIIMICSQIVNHVND